MAAVSSVDFNGANLKLNQYGEEQETAFLSDSDSENTLIPDKRLIIIGQDVGADDLLISDNTMDYDWLLSPPRNPVVSLEVEEQKTLACHSLISDGQSSSPDSKVENLPTDNTSMTNIAPKLPASSSGVKSFNATIRRPSPARKAPLTGSRSSTPTARPTLPSTTKPLRSSTPTSRATVAATKPVAPSKRSITPTARPSILAAQSKSISRSSTPTNRPSVVAATKSASRSSTPTARPSIVSISKSTSRSSTPTARPSNSSGLLNTSVNGSSSSSAVKARAPSRGSSPSVKSRPSKNLPEKLESTKKSMPERSASSSKERPSVPTVKSNATEINVKAIPKRTSYSPSRGHISNGSVKSGVTRSRGYSNGNDDVNPVLMGTKMVERVVNMRKLAPPRQDHISIQNNTAGKLSVSQDNSGFGRSLSKKSLDMALRHLDIRRSMPGNMRAMITKVPASSVYSVRSESTKTHTINASDSPLATSSSASSDHSENGHSYHQ
uniref:zonadhesin-like n=1 Tax=Erigeron canadensis TaxID=72917 RepID=UPI001CB92380|nr:zonadhesin-like [Erigeron canadensis]